MTDIAKAVAQAYIDMLEAKKKKMDPVDKSELSGEFDDREDKDLDNDGDTDSSDKYLHKKRQAISKATEKDTKKASMEEAYDDHMDKAADHSAEANHHRELAKDAARSGDHDAGAHHQMAADLHRTAAKKYEKAADSGNAMHAATAKTAGKKAMQAAQKAKSMNESKDLNTDNAAKALEHDCATHVQHEQYGMGKCIPGQHTLVAIDETRGYVTHYDVEFDHGIEEDVAVEDLKIISEMSHGHPKKKKMKRESFSDYAGYEVKGWEVVQENEDGTFDAFINGEFYRDLDEEKAKELKHKNIAKAQPEGQEKLDMTRTKGEEEFVSKSTGGETVDNPETVKQDGSVVPSQAPKRGQEKRANEPMKSVTKVQGQ